MSNNQNNPQEVPQVKSVEEKMTDIIRRIPVNQANLDYISKSQHGINGSLAQDIKSAMKEYAKPLAARIAELERRNIHLQEYSEKERVRRSNFALRISELEAENAKLIEALRNIADSTDGEDITHCAFYFTAINALNSKEG